MTLDWVGWLAWVMASLWALVQTSCGFEMWLSAFAAALFTTICVNEIWAELERSRERK